jgi:ADP-heptose:LPS heptosyltransferase
LADDGSLLSRELEYNRQILESVLDRPVLESEVLPFQRFSDPGRNIVISPFGSAPIRDIPMQILCRTIEIAFSNLEEPVLLMGTTQQEGRLLLIAKALEQKISQIEICCRLSVNDYIDTIGKARLVITAETATAHIATAYDRPTLVVLGGGHYGQFGPWRRSSRQQWITHRMDCEGCNWNCRYSTPLCLTGIPNSQAEEAIDCILKAE